MKNTASLQEVPVTCEPRDRQHTAAMHGKHCMRESRDTAVSIRQTTYAVAFRNRVYTDTRPLHAHQVVIVHVKLIN